MSEKPVFALDTGTAESAFAPPAEATQLDAVLRRLTGDGLLNLIKARAEVAAAVRAAGGGVPSAPALDDGLPAGSIPSVRAGQSEDRVLAEIDQDGYAFAVHPRDEPFFNRRERFVPRQQNLVDIVLLDGRVCVRKRFRGFRPGARRWGDRPIPAWERTRRHLWVNLGLYLYSEAAALLRLQRLPFVPKVRAIDLADRALYVDCVEGESLRTLAARGGAVVHDRDLAADPQLSRLSTRELERREVALLEASSGGGFRKEIAGMARQVNALGVAPLDIKLGNFIRGAATGRLYWIDFEISRLASQPRWEPDLARQRAVLEEVFELSARGFSV
jgi:hypothetical protein